MKPGAESLLQFVRNRSTERLNSMDHEGKNVSTGRLPYVWDYDIDRTQFDRLLNGDLTIGRLDRDWAAVRLIEYARYREIVERLGFRALVEGWPQWRKQVRSEGRKRGLDFLVAWLSEHHPELL